jgi:hypothetical protein
MFFLDLSKSGMPEKHGQFFLSIDSIGLRQREKGVY